MIARPKGIARLALAAALAAPAAAFAEAPLRGFCAALPRAAAERALGLRTFGPDALDDRLGPYRRQLCRLQTDPGEMIEFAVWSRTDRRPMPPLPARAEACDIGCLAMGREPNLYRYEQRRIGTALCVIRRPRADRDLATGPITACTSGGPRRAMLSVSRKQGLAAAPMAAVKLLLDRAAASLR